MTEQSTKYENDSWNDNYDTDNSNFDDNDEQNDQKHTNLMIFK